MFLKPSIVINLQQNMGDFAKLCNEHNFKPTKEELTDIINYLLVIQHYSMNGTMTESVDNLSVESLNESTLNYLYENFEMNLVTEKGGDDGDELTGLANAATALLTGVAGALTGGKGGKDEGDGLFAYLSFLFKKGKIKSVIKSIDAINQKQLSLFKNLVELENKKAELTGKEPVGIKSHTPSYQ